MANRLRMAKVHSIQTLRALGWSQRRIARELGVDRGTVARYLRLGGEPQDLANPPPGWAGCPDPPIGGQNQPNPPTGSPGWPDGASGHQRPPDQTGWDCQNQPNLPTGSDHQNQPNPPLGSTGPPSRCEPFRDTIQTALEHGLSAQRIWQDLRSEQGFTGGYDTVKRFCRRLQQTQALPFRRIEVAPGDQAQVDFGRGAPIITADGKRKCPHVFRIVLSCSRKAYSEAVERQTTENFIGCLENAFWHFGGVPRTLVFDYVPGHIIDHRAQRHAAKGLEGQQQSADQRLDLLVGDDDYVRPAGVLQARGEEVQLLADAVGVGDADAAEVVLAELARHAFKAYFGAVRLRDAQPFDEFVDGGLAAAVTQVTQAAENLDGWQLRLLAQDALHVRPPVFDLTGSADAAGGRSRGRSHARNSRLPQDALHRTLPYPDVRRNLRQSVAGFTKYSNSYTVEHPDHPPGPSR
jgi:transposase